MNFNFHDATTALPVGSGIYTWWSRQLGHITVKWIEGQWFFMNGDMIPNNLVKWWK